MTDVDRLLAQIRDGSAVEIDEALERLGLRAQAAEGDADAWSHLALGLQLAGRTREAIGLFEQIVEAHPDVDVYRLNLATTYSQARQFELCKLHLRHLAERGATEEIRKIGREQLAGLEHFLGETEERQRLQQLQTEGLREKLAAGQGGADDHVRLARLLLQREQQEPNEKWLAEATRVLERARSRFPDEIEVLEHLALCYLRRDPQGRLDELLRAIEARAPDSGVLEVLESSQLDDARVEQQGRQLREQAYELLNKAQSEDSEIQRAAVEGLRRMVAFSPENSEYRIVYAWALGIVGRQEEALEQASRLAESPAPRHSLHFNLGQIFWMCGDPKRGRHHLELSQRYAENDQERQDAAERIAALSRKE